ncbi:hypothetical protein [Paenibacillus chitinolyticus]
MTMAYEKRKHRLLDQDNNVIAILPRLTRVGSSVKIKGTLYLIVSYDKTDWTYRGVPVFGQTERKQGGGKCL